MIQPDQATDDKIIQSMRNSCWITEATGIHSEYVIGMLISFPRQQMLQELVSLLRLQIHCLIVQELLMWPK
jgi:hypothetical protein